MQPACVCTQATNVGRDTPALLSPRLCWQRWAAPANGSRRCSSLIEHHCNSSRLGFRIFADPRKHMYRATNRRSRAGSMTAASLPPPRLQIPDEPPRVPRRPPSKGNKRETLGDIAKRIPVQLMRQYFNYPLRAAAEVRVRVCVRFLFLGSASRVAKQRCATPRSRCFRAFSKQLSGRLPVSCFWLIEHVREVDELESKHSGAAVGWSSSCWDRFRFGTVNYCIELVNWLSRAFSLPVCLSFGFVDSTRSIAIDERHVRCVGPAHRTITEPHTHTLVRCTKKQCLGPVRSVVCVGAR